MDDVVSTNFCDCFKRAGSGLRYPMFQTSYTVYIYISYHSSPFPCQDLRNLLYILSIQHQHLPLSLLMHCPYGEKCPTHNQCDVLLLNQHFRSWQTYFHHQIHEGHWISQSSPIVPAVHSSCCHTTAIVSHNFLKGRSQWIATHHQTSQIPRFFLGFEKIWDFYSNIRGEPWKIYHLFICFISWDESVLHLKNSSLIQATRQGFLQVEFTQRWSTPFLRYKGICLGFQTFDWDIGKLHTKKSHHPGKIQSMFREDSFPKTLLKVRSFQIPMSRSQ